MFPLKDENPTRRRPWATLAIVLACAAVFFLWQPTPFADTTEDVAFNATHAAVPCEVVHHRGLTLDEVRATYGLGGRDDACGLGDPRSPDAFPRKAIWTSVLVSMFLHASVVHLLGNLLFLWIFGNNVEDRLGRVRYVGFYLVGGVVATLTHVLLDVHSTIPMVGASGAIAAVMGAYLVWFPEAPVRTLIFVGIPWIVRVRAKWLLGLWFALQFLTSPTSGVAWAAHVGGFAFGVVAGLAIRFLPPVRRLALVREFRTGPWDPAGGGRRAWSRA